MVFKCEHCDARVSLMTMDSEVLKGMETVDDGEDARFWVNCVPCGTGMISLWTCKHCDCSYDAEEMRTNGDIFLCSYCLEKSQFIDFEPIVRGNVQ